MKGTNMDGRDLFVTLFALPLIHFAFKSEVIIIPDQNAHHSPTTPLRLNYRRLRYHAPLLFF